MPTPHIAAPDGAFAPAVLMPGDPKRARYIAETFLDDAELITSVRAVEGFTGRYQGVPVSVMAHGMGMPSMNIYATELARFYGCTRLIRVGSCGALREDVPMRQVIACSAAGTDSSVNRHRVGGHDLAAVAEVELLKTADRAAADLDVDLRVGPVFTSDSFYSGDTGLMGVLADHGVLAVEMEVAGLYGVAAAEGISALALLTVSDHLLTTEQLTPDERATSFADMMRVALAVAIS